MTPVGPCAQAEWFYDTRFDAWSRQRDQLGAEIELDKHWRIEPYLLTTRTSYRAPKV